MRKRLKVSRIEQALEYSLIAALQLGSCVAGALGAIKWASS
ncbi:MULTISPECIES: hypothetical protein [unclassified Sphingomonas]|nr:MULTISPECIES: hypothetical protein [unclassified Sphingomonas]